MSDAKLSPLKQAIVELRELRAENDRLRAQLEAPIAVVGLGCRFPGGIDGPDAFWQALLAGTDAISETPADRWDVDELYDPDHEAPGRMATRWGGFVDRVDTFDPRFFGISPREAEAMDPQQRMMLEVSWETLEHAGVPADKLDGSRTGVICGIGTNDYAALQIRQLDLATIDTYYATGAVSHSVSSGSCVLHARDCAGRRCRSIRPAHRRSSRCIWPCRRCAPAKPI